MRPEGDEEWVQEYSPSPLQAAVEAEVGAEGMVEEQLQREVEELLEAPGTLRTRGEHVPVLAPLGDAQTGLSQTVLAQMVLVPTQVAAKHTDAGPEREPYLHLAWPNDERQP